MLHLLYAFVAFVASTNAAPQRTGNRDSCALLRRGTEYVVNSSLVDLGELVNISAVAAQNVTATNAVSFCRVEGKIPYGANSTLNFEVWLPEGKSYNDRYLSVGM